VAAHSAVARFSFTFLFHSVKFLSVGKETHGNNPYKQGVQMTVGEVLNTLKSVNPKTEIVADNKAITTITVPESGPVAIGTGPMGPTAAVPS
jgi:hypothetical protein